MIPEPYYYIRAITLGLGFLWTVRGFYRLYRFARTWEHRLDALGLERRWLRRQIAHMTLRATVLDPLNLGLMLLLFASWTLRSWG